MGRIVSLSLDLDNKWSYLRTYGNDDWRQYPSYLGAIVPRILKYLADRDVKITFFVVGRDATDPQNQEAIASLSAAGHEIGNHSFNHEPWLHLYSMEELDRELQKAEDAIREVTGVQVRGFRGPGFSITESVLNVLQKRNYKYDATAFPNILNPLARAYLFATTNLSKEEKKRRKALFGSFSDAFRPVKPYQWNLQGAQLLELPVSTMPVFKTPIHFSYLTWLGGYSKTLACAYMKVALTMCELTNTEPSLLLHPLDFMGREDDSDLSSFPAMTLPLNKKLELMDTFFDMLFKKFTPMTVGDHVEQIQLREGLKEYQPVFSR